MVLGSRRPGIVCGWPFKEPVLCCIYVQAPQGHYFNILQVGIFPAESGLGFACHVQMLGMSAAEQARPQARLEVCLPYIRRRTSFVE